MKENATSYTSMKEKYHILYNREDCSLKTRDELFGHCPPQKRTSPEMGGNLTIGIFLNTISLFN